MVKRCQRAEGYEIDSYRPKGEYFFIYFMTQDETIGHTHLCKFCKFYSKDEVCFNGESEFVADFRKPNDTCKEFKKS